MESKFQKTIVEFGSFLKGFTFFDPNQPRVKEGEKGGQWTDWDHPYVIDPGDPEKYPFGVRQIEEDAVKKLGLDTQKQLEEAGYEILSTSYSQKPWGKSYYLKVRPLEVLPPNVQGWETRTIRISDHSVGTHRILSEIHIDAHSRKMGDAIKRGVKSADYFFFGNRYFKKVDTYTKKTYQDMINPANFNPKTDVKIGEPYISRRNKPTLKIMRTVNAKSYKLEDIRDGFVL